MAINVGDLVRITDTRESYSSYQEMFRQLGFRSDEQRTNPYSVGDVLRVFQSILAHPDGTTLYGLEHPTTRNSTQILMNQRGIEYVFPGNWHIRVTAENNEMLGNWRQAGSIDGLEGIILSEHHGSRGYWMAGGMDIPDHCRTQITTEQFRQYVLNQTPTNMPTQTTLPEQEYQNALDAMNLQPGDIVRVTQRWASYRDGWNNAWAEDMDNYVGNEYEVRRVSDNRNGVVFYHCPFNFPIYSLELVRRPPHHIPTPSFVLPEKWAIAVTEENRNDLIDWRSGGLDLPDGYCLSMHQGYWVSDLRHYQDYTLISTEQFRRYVLNQQLTDMPTPTTNLENEQEDAVVTTTEKVICITDKWNYVNLGEVYEVVKRDEYYTYVKDSVGGESRYAHHYFEEWVDAETKAKRDSFKALFGDHSKTMFKNASDEVQKLMSDLYPKLYEYTGWIKLKKDNNHESAWLFEGLDIRLIQDEDTPNEKLRGTIRFDQSDYILDTFQYQGHTFIRFKRNR